MTNYLLNAGGLINGSFPWSIRMNGTGTLSEATTQTTWDAAIVALWTNATLAPYIPPTTSLTYTYTSTASATWTQTTATRSTHSTAGTSTSPSLPYGVAEVVTLRTAFSTKWGRGRVYLPPLATNALAATGFTLLAAAQTAIVTGMNAFFAALGSNIGIVILHRKAPLSGAVGAYSISAITAADVPSTFHVQKRRADKAVPVRSSIVI